MVRVLRGRRSQGSRRLSAVGHRLRQVATRHQDRVSCAGSRRYSNVKQPFFKIVRGRKAATKIQALWRGRGHRAHFLMLRRIALRTERDAAARRIQVLWNGHQGRQAARARLRDYSAAARKVQKAWHHYQFWNDIRRTVRGGRRATAPVCARQLRVRAAISLLTKVMVCARFRCGCAVETVGSCEARQVVPSAAHQEVPQDARNHREDAAVTAAQDGGLAGGAGVHVRWLATGMGLQGRVAGRVGGGHFTVQEVQVGHSTP